MSGIKTIKPEDATKVPFNLDGRIMFSSEDLEIILLKLLPGEGMDLHTQPFDVVFYVISGKGILRTEDSPVEGDTGYCIHVPAGLKRGWKNDSTGDLQILVMKNLK